jgi:flagellar hook assembly protein FlgD
VPARGHTVISFFGANLPGAKIRIYNKAGELVQTLKETQNLDRLDWDAKSSNGKNLASGIYIFVAEGKSGEKWKGKFGIIR